MAPLVPDVAAQGHQGRYADSHHGAWRRMAPAAATATIREPAAQRIAGHGAQHQEEASTSEKLASFAWKGDSIIDHRAKFYWRVGSSNESKGVELI